MSIQKNKVKVGLIGGSGYPGGELIRLLITTLNHRFYSKTINE